MVLLSLIHIYYPIAIAALTMFFGAFALKETHGTLIWDEAETSA